MDSAAQEDRVSVRLSQDRMSATLSVRAGAASGPDEVAAALSQSAVRWGIDASVVARITLGLADPNFEIRPQIVARGAAVTRGEDGRFEPFFREGIQPGAFREDGTLDFHDRELLKPVCAGDALGRIVPARPGTAGHLVDGTELAAPPVHELKLTLGAGVTRGEDGTVRAARAGVIAYKSDHSLDVVEQHVHQGSVDLHSGHLHMQGSLRVNGDVTHPFSVSASGDVEIRGGVLGGSVQGGGDVRILQGVHGGDGGLVSAGGNLSARRAESASLHAGRLLQVVDAVHSQLSAARVEIAGKLRGGVTRAEYSVIAREAGTAQRIDTEIAVGEPLESPSELAQRALERGKVLRAARSGQGASVRGAGERAKGAKLSRLQAELSREQTQRLAERARRRELLSQVAFIQIQVAHPGVTIRILHHQLQLEVEARSTRFLLDPETRTLRADRLPT